MNRGIQNPVPFKMAGSASQPWISALLWLFRALFYTQVEAGGQGRGQVQLQAQSSGPED